MRMLSCPAHRPIHLRKGYPLNRTISCPQCHTALDPISDADARSVVCSTCGSSVFLESSRATQTMRTLDTGPRRLGKFELLEELGFGSFGFVYRARDTELERIVALKIPRPGVLASPEAVARFLREGRSAARLKHPRIVALFEIGHSDSGDAFLVSEFIQGVTLDDRLSAGRLPFRHSAELIAEIAEALAYAHGEGVIHRDIKPSNIMLDTSGRPYLMDFGLAKRDTDEIVMTLEGEVLGTPAYMPPEQAAGHTRSGDARSDVYSLGVIFYQLLTGEIPFRGNARMVIAQVLGEDPVPPRKLNDHIPRDLETICLKAMAKQPGKRYETAQAFADDLRRHLAGDPIHARPLGPAARLWRWCKRNPVATSLILVISLCAVVGLWSLSVLSTRLQRETALAGADLQARLLGEVNAFYSNVMTTALVHHPQVPVTHDYKNIVGAVPIPATFLTDVAEKISATECGMEVRHYSEYPFAFRKDGGPKDDFERATLAAFAKDPALPFYARFEEYGGELALRYAVPRLMKESCIDCHNTHPESPKKDWHVGEVRGVLEIIRPLHAEHDRVLAGLRESFLFTFIVSVSLLAVLVAFIVFQGRRRSLRREVAARDRDRRG